MLTLTLVRHGATAFNAERRYQGHLDPPLSPEGEAQARTLAGVLGPEVHSARCAHPGCHGAARAAAVHASDLRRARETAALALPGISAALDRRLRELDFGAFDGRSYEQNLAAFGDAFRAWIADPARVRPPGGESLAELEARVIGWLDGLPREGHVIAFTHGGPIRVVLAHLRQVPFTAAPYAPVAPGGAIRLVVPAYRAGRLPERVRILFVLSGHIADLPAPLDPDPSPHPDPVGTAGADFMEGANDASPRPDPSR